MKRSTIATTALALAASVFAGSSMAVTVTNVFENFSGVADGTAILGRNVNNLSWTTNGTDNLSIITGEKLELDTGSDGLVTATLTTNDVNVALAANETATFSANVSFYPATEAPTINDDNHDLKFALYAKAGVNETNLMVFANNGEADTGIDITSTAVTNVTVNFTSSSTFTVTVGGTTSSSFNFRNGTGISKVEFQGNGSVDDLTIAYTSTLDASDGITVQPNSGSGTKSHELTATEADYLNSLVETYGKAAVDDTLADVTEETFEKASLLNQDITQTGAASATFSITDIKRRGNNVTVSVKLVRNGEPLGGVNGTVALYTCDTPNGEYTKFGSFGAVLTSEAKEAEASKEFTGVTAPFFKVVIEN